MSWQSGLLYISYDQTHLDCLWLNIHQLLKVESTLAMLPLVVVHLIQLGGSINNHRVQHDT